ncbi:MAG: amino acid adenylation domain-containing protein, partial [Rhodocyclaceae bacterium]
IAGAGLARGYLLRPELTAERFLPDPFAHAPGQRMYRSGDKARYRADGSIEFLGRLDDQVKIRGFRIELGEVEAALQACAQVRTATVVAREDSPGDRRLVAYVVPADAEHARDTAALAAGLREQLGARLPAYMVPAAFVVIDALPVTRNGKLDRRALPAPDYADGRTAYVAPDNEAEQAIAALWGQLLKIERVGADDNFFDLGGHSLLATQAMSRLRQALGVDLPLRALFEGPTVRQLARRALAAQADGAVVANGMPLRPVARDGHLPLSFAQQRLWFLAQLEPDNPFYNMPAALRLHGQLDVAAFWRTLDAVVARHEVLRTRFAMVDGAPGQHIQPAYRFDPRVEDLSALAPAMAEQEAARLAQDAVRRPFALECEVPIRVRLLRMNAHEHIVLFTMHHIAADGWSLSVLIREVAALYAAFVRGEPSPLAPLALQYADFAHWQRRWLSGDVLQAQLDYWRQRLDGAPPVLSLPTDFPRPAVRTYDGAAHAIMVDARVGSALKALARAHDATLYMVLLAAFNLLLARYAAQTDICVGTAIANRTRRETEGLIGFFVNTLVMRNDLSGDPRFSELLQRVRDVARDAYAHQDLPFEQLVEAINPPRDLAHSPLFQVSLVLQNTPVEVLELPGVRLSPADIQQHGVARFDLTLYVAETERGIRLNVGYNTALFRADTIARLAGQLDTLLGQIAADPQRRLSQLDMVSDAERPWLQTVSHGASPAPVPAHTFHALFEAQCRRTPQAAAVRCREHVLSYAELNERADALAHALRQHGVGPDVCVGLLLERSVDMLVGVLGIFKAAGAYVPLSAEAPPDRLARQLANVGAPVVVAHAAMRAALPATVAVLCLDGERPAVASVAPSGAAALPGHLAYVIHTSGSTGQPKGVAVTHANLVNYSRALADLLQAAPGMQFATVSTLAADLGNTAIFPALMIGGCVHLIDQDVALDAARFADYLQAHAIDVLKIVPSHLNALMAGGQGAEVLPRVALVLGGEALPTALAARLEQAAPGLRRLNHYGPTETTVGALTWAIPGACDPPQGAATIPIGHPIAGARAHVLAADGAQLPIGVAGELFIGGAGVARAYVGQAGHTAERFVPDPFGPPGARLYRTGDRVRRLPDGAIEFIGRVDDQIKIRGYRVEPAEVEAAIGSHAAVRAVTVQCRADAMGDAQLVAYVVADGIDEAALRTYLRQHLPDYMLPAQCLFVDRIALTANGKVDRRALPEPGARRPSDAYVAPRSPLEEELAAIWCALLRRERVGVHDNFFELGGHSLLATQLVSRVREAFHVALPLRSVFAAGTVAELAALVETHLMERIASLSDEEVAAMLDRLRRRDPASDPVSA